MTDTIAAPFRSRWQSPCERVTLYHGDCLDVLRTLPDESVHCCVTSPPYWGLRDYGIEGQIGLEQTPEAYVARMVEVFREVRRVLRGDATLWLNLGDTIQGKQLQGIPWRTAFALQADGWFLRQEICWIKGNPMPESVTDRFTKCTESVFLLAKSARYFFDAEAVKEDAVCAGNSSERVNAGALEQELDPLRFRTRPHGRTCGYPPTRNRRNAWFVNTRPYSGAHFATMPPDLVEPCVKAGTSEHGCCATCGAPWERVVEKTGGISRDRPHKPKDKMIDGGHGGRGSDTSRLSRPGWREDEPLQSRTIGWQPTCECGGSLVPCTVLDPFNGAGTTGLVSLQHGRRYVGIDLNDEYLRLTRERLAGELAQGRLWE